MISTALSCLLLLTAPQDPPAPGGETRKPVAEQPGTVPVPVPVPDSTARSAPDPLDVLPCAEMLPGDALAVLAMAPAAAHRFELMKSGIDDLVRWIGPAWKRTDYVSQLALAPVHIQELLASGFTLAVTDVEMNTGLHWILVARMATKRIATIRAGLPDAHAEHATRGCVVSEESAGDATTWTVAASEGQSVAYTLTEDSLLIGSSMVTVRAALEQLNDVDSSLAAARPYSRFARKCAAEGQPFLTLFVQPQPAIRTILSMLPGTIAAKNVHAFLDHLEVPKITELGMSFFAKDGLLRDFTWIGYPAPRSGVLAALLNGEHTVHPDQLKPVSRDAVSVSLFTMDLPRVYRESVELAGMMNPKVLEFVNKAIQNIESHTKVNLESDVLASIGNRGTLQEWNAEDGSRVIGLTLALSDGAKLQRSFDAVAAVIRARSVEISIPDTSATAGNPKNRASDKIQAYVLEGLAGGSFASVYIAIVGNTLVIANASDCVARVAASLREDSSNHSIAIQLRSRASMPNSFNWGSCARLGTEFMKTLGTNAGHRGLTHELAEIVRVRGGSIVTTVDTMADGIVCRSQSPFGNIYLTLGLAYVFKQGELIGDDVQVASTRRLSLVHDVVAAQNDYIGARHTDEDGDAKGEYGTIADLIDHSLLSSRWFGQPAPDETVQADGYNFRVYQPKGTDARERDYLLLAWPVDRKPGDVFAASGNGAVHVNEIIGRTGNLTRCDPRDYFAGGKFGAEILPSWKLLRSSAARSQRDQAAPAREFTTDEKIAIELLDSAAVTGKVPNRIVRLLESRNFMIASRAAFVIGNLRHRPAVLQLCAVVRGHDDEAVRRQAMAALCKLRDVQSVETSIDALTSPDPVIRTLAAQNLGYLHAKQATKKLLDVVSFDSQEDASDRIAALLALADIGEPDCLLPAAARVKKPGKEDEKALVYLFQTLSNKLAPVSEAETLMAVLDDESTLLRRFAIQRLGVLALPIAEPALEKQLAKNDSLRNLVEVSLGVIRDAQTAEKIKGLVANATKRGRELWNSVPAYVSYGVLGVFVLLILVVRRMSRRRHRARASARAAAMVAPSEGFADEYDDEFDEEYEGEYEGEEEYEDGEEYEDEVELYDDPSDAYIYDDEVHARK